MPPVIHLGVPSPSCSYYGNYEEMLADPKVNVIKDGVFVEKTPENLKEAMRICDSPLDGVYPIYELNKLIVFVYGSNLKGAHGRGAARQAVFKHGAKYGVGEGRTGNAYAIPTKDENIQTLPLDRIATYVDRFKEVTASKYHKWHFITPVGTGLAGYKDEDIAPMFKGVVRCWLPSKWKPFLE